MRRTRPDLVRGTPGLGLLAALALGSVVGLVASPLAAASPTLATGGWSPGASVVLSGCATATARLPHWFPANATGQLRSVAASKICSVQRGGPSFGSFADAVTALTVAVPVALPSGPGGVNLSWRAVGLLGTSGTVTSSAPCPVHHAAANYDLGYTWFNYTETYASCDVAGSASFEGFAYLVDRTNGTVFAATNGWSGAFNISGAQNTSFRYAQTYSNRSYWSSNASYNYSFVYGFGAAGSIAVSGSPTWFINGSFLATHQYDAVSVFTADAQAASSGYPQCRAAALSVFAGPGRGIHLTGAAVW